MILEALTVFAIFALAAVLGFLSSIGWDLFVDRSRSRAFRALSFVVLFVLPAAGGALAAVFALVFMVEGELTQLPL